MRQMQPAHRGEDMPVERTGVRCSMLIQAVVGSGDAADRGLKVRVRNLSEGGLMATTDDVIQLDDRLRVQLRGIGWVAGKVIWREPNRFGMAFDSPVDPRRAFKPV